MVGEALLHAPLVGGANVLQAEGHGHVAVRTIRGDERGCELIGPFHRDLVIARPSRRLERRGSRNPRWSRLSGLCVAKESDPLDTLC